LAPLAEGWLPSGAFHYDRAGNYLSQVSTTLDQEACQAIIPSLGLVRGGAVLWIIVGDGARVRAKYQERGLRFLLLEAGHLMQNLCLLATSCGHATVPLGGFFETPLARHLDLCSEDEVLYVGVCGPIDN
jgi:SagB-type dehydrogenase family enzyme